MEYEYIVVRTYHGGDGTSQLTGALANGYEFVHASEFIEPTTANGRKRLGYIEYILRKKK